MELLSLYEERTIGDEMQRYFIKGEIIQEKQIIEMDAEQSHHIRKVLRMQIGERIEIVDSAKRLYIAEVIELMPVTIQLQQELQQQVELPIEVTILVGLSKGEKLDWIVQKATEMGVHTIIPVIMKRNMVKWTSDKAAKKVERLQKIASEAAEQAHRLQIPMITNLLTVEEAIQVASNRTAALVAFEEVAKQGERAQLVETLQQLQAGDSLAIFFGPEGGLEEQEIQKMQLAGIKACALGPRILRAETAPLYALAAISYQSELL